MINLIINLFWSAYVGLIPEYTRFLIDGIAFISNIENILMGEILQNNYFLMTEENSNIKFKTIVWEYGNCQWYIKNYINDILINNSNTINLYRTNDINYEIILKNYIMKEYYLFNNNYVVELDIQHELLTLIKDIFLNFEIFLIGFQKLIYEYNDYFKYLYDYYSNFKILIDKNIINLNIREELYYNISLELVSDIHKEHNKSLWWLVQHSEFSRLKKDIWVQIFKNYFQIFKENPYKISKELLYLYKDYPRINILSYGLDYDLNILTNNNFFFKENSINKYNNVDKFLIKNLDKNIILEQDFLNFNYTNIKELAVHNDIYKKYLIDFEKRYTKKMFYRKFSWYRSWLHLFNNRFINFDFLRGSILAADWYIKYDVPTFHWKTFIPKPILRIPSFIDLDYRNLSPIKGWATKTIKGQIKPEYITIEFRWPKFIINWIPNIARKYFVGIWNYTNVEREGSTYWYGDVTAWYSKDKHNLKKLFGGYSYWWAWHQDATFLYKYGLNFKPRKQSYLHFTFFHKLYQRLPVITDNLIDWEGAVKIYNNKMRLVRPEMSNQTVRDILDPESELNQSVIKLKPKNIQKNINVAIQINKNIEDPEILEDTNIEQLKLDKEFNQKLKNKELTVFDLDQFAVKRKLLYKEAADLEKRRAKLDPLGLSRKLERKYFYYHVLSMPYFENRVEKSKKLLPRLGFRKLIAGKYAKKYSKYGDEFLIKWDIRTSKRKKYLRVLMHGQKGLRLNKHFFKMFLLSNDVWMEQQRESLQHFLKTSKKIPEKFFRKSRSSRIKELRNYPFKTLFRNNMDWTLNYDTKSLKDRDLIDRALLLSYKYNFWRQFKRFVPISMVKERYEKYTLFFKHWYFAGVHATRWNWKLFKWLFEDPALRDFMAKGEILSPTGSTGYVEKLTELVGLRRRDIPGFPKRPKFSRDAKIFRQVFNLYPYKDIKKILFNLITIKYNAPYLSVKKNQSITNMIKFGANKEKFYNLEKTFLKYFYGESAKILKKRKFKHDILIKLKNTTPYEEQLNNVKKIFYTYFYKYAIEPKYQVTLTIKDRAMSSMRGYITQQYSYDAMFSPNYLSSINYIRRNVITWNTFYTNIESVSEPLNLNIIYKNFYGGHTDSEISTSFLYKKQYLVNDIYLPKTKNLLLKKSFIKNLIYVYQKEDKPVINYIFLYIKKEEFLILHKTLYKTFYNAISLCISTTLKFFYFIILKFTNFYKFVINFFLELIMQKLLLFREVRRLKRHYLEYYEIYKYWFIIGGYILIYIIICIFLVVIIKSFLPKNLIYGVKSLVKKKENKFEPINNNIVSWFHAESIEERFFVLENMMDVDINKKEIHKDIIRNIKNVDDLTIENLKKLEFDVKVKKLKFNKNFFDAEHRYIYSWDKGYHKPYEEQQHGMRKSVQNLEKIKIYTKFEEKKKKDIEKNYVTLYKNFIFEKNLEKWENNTKISLDFNYWVYELQNLNIVRKILRGLWIFHKDKRYNHNRVLFWDDASLDNFHKVQYMFLLPKPFAGIFLVIRFFASLIKLWDINYWITKWRQYVMYGVHAGIDYVELKNNLKKNKVLEWFKEDADYSVLLYYKDFVKVIKKYNKIKEEPISKKAKESKLQRDSLLNTISKLAIEEDKLKTIHKYLKNFNNIKIDRLNFTFSKKFEDIKVRMMLDIETEIKPKKWAEQVLRYEYLDLIYKKKLELVKNEYEDLKQSYTKRVRRDREDKERTLQTLDWVEEKNIMTIMEQKIEKIESEKNLREYNFNNKIVDEALDEKENSFYAELKDYNEKLNEKYLKIEKEERDERLKDSLYEKKSRNLYGVLEENYVWYRWFTTMGARINYLFVLITHIFIGWVSNIKKIRRNEYSIRNLFKIMWIDLCNYICKIYFEYLIISGDYKVLKNWGFKIKEIFKFSLIITPIIIYSSMLYIIFVLYLLLIIILYFTPKKLYIKYKKAFKIKLGKNLLNKLLNIIKKVANYFKYIFNLIKLLFINIETGNTILDELYIKIYKFLGWIQYNNYMLQNSFFLGYNKKKEFIEGWKIVKEWLNLKYTSYIEIKKLNKIRKEKISNKKKNISTVYDLKLKWFVITRILIIRHYTENTIKYYLWKFFWKVIDPLYVKYIYPVTKLQRKEFYKLLYINTELYRTYYKVLKNKAYALKSTITKLTLIDFIKTILKIIWQFVTLPIIFVIDHQKYKYIKNYKQGIQGFRDNPMHLILDYPVKQNDWKVKLHNYLMEGEISKFLEGLQERTDSLIDIMFMYKISEVKWTNKNYYQDFFWRKWYWYYKEIKKYTLNFLIKIALKIEENYKTFEESIETKNFSIWERCLYAYYSYRMYKHLTTRPSQKRISRDAFFYKKAKARKKLLRIYFIKGIINWLTYITINKIFFTELHDLKSEKIKYKHIKYYLKNLKANMHITEDMKNIPPQFWALVIIYNVYYRYLLRYKLSDPEYPIKWEDNVDMEFNTNYKWRLAPPEHNYEVAFYRRRYIAADINSYAFTEFVTTLANEPYDPILRWILFLLEYGMSTEELISEGTAIWINSSTDTHNVWGDISLAHLLTYNIDFDEYKYEIKDFNRLVKGIDFLNVAENTLERDKKRDYDDKFRLLSNIIKMETEDILKNILAERRIKRAKILHKALVYYKLKSKYDLDAEKHAENTKEYFYVRKRQFFENEFIEEFWDWQAQYDEGVSEDKYFNTRDLYNVTYQSHVSEDYHLKCGDLTQHAHLIDNIVLKSYDQTIEEINYFLTFKAWKMLENNLKKKKKKIEINYKHLVINSKLLSKLNNIEHLQKRITREKKNNEENIITYYEYKYGKLEWESTKTEALYGFVENNLLFSYFEIGDNYTYESKIEYNEEALRYVRHVKDFHDQSYIRRWSNLLRKRHTSLKNIKKLSLKNIKKIPLNIAYINNIKWTWEQWLIFENIEKEDELLNKNIVVLNERYRLWNLKRVPMRIKLPVILEIDRVEVKDYLKDKSNYISYIDHRHTLMTRNIWPLLKQSLVWERCKIGLEKHFGRDIQDLILWIFSADMFNTKMMKLKQEYQYVFKNFAQNYGVFHKLYFLGMAQYSWDLIRYHEAWWGQDEFPYDQYFKLKQMEYLNHDPAARRVVRKLYKIYLDMYSPVSYIYFFKYQLSGGILYHIYGILYISSILWGLKVLFYNPGAFISDIYMLMGPILCIMGFWYLRKGLKGIKDASEGLELYLYRYHTSKTLEPNEWIREKYWRDKNQREWIEHFYDPDKIEEIFGSLGEVIDNQRDPYWWRYHSHRNKHNNIYGYEQTKWWAIAFIGYFMGEYWRDSKFKYRNSKWLWEYYKHDPDLLEFLKKQGMKNAYIPKNYQENLWYADSWTRFENGGNWFSRWYENHYRRLWKMNIKPLDYGFKWQKLRVVMPYQYDGKIYNIPCAFADANWIKLSHKVSKYNALSDEYKDFTKELNLKEVEDKLRRYWKKKIKKKRKKSQYKEFFYEHYINRLFVRKYLKEKDNWRLLKDMLIDAKNSFKDIIKKIYLGRDYIHKRHPLKHWAKLIQWARNKTNYNLVADSYMDILIAWKAQVKIFIENDTFRYYWKSDSIVRKFYIIQHFKDYLKNQELIKHKEIKQKKRESYFLGNELDVNILLRITEWDKHMWNIYYNVAKNKQYRLLRNIVIKRNYTFFNLDKKVNFLKTYKGYEQKRYEDEAYFYKWYHHPNVWLTKEYYRARWEWSRDSDPLLYNTKNSVKTWELYRKYKNWKKRYLANKEELERIEKYVININKSKELKKITEYRYDLIVDLWKQKINIVDFLKDFFFDFNFIEFVNLSVKIISKIFG